MDLDRRLAEKLSDYPIIWDRARKDFRDIEKKERAFIKLASEIGTTAEICMARYKALREKYRKEKVKTKAEDEDQWELFETLKFLDDFMFRRKRLGHLSLIPQTNKPARIEQSTVDGAEASLIDIRDDPLWQQIKEEPHDEMSFLATSNLDEMHNSRSSSNSEVASTSASVTYTPKPKKRKESESSTSNPTMEEMIKSIKDTALLLREGSEPRKSRFYHFGLFVAESLEEMDSEEAKKKVAQIADILTR